MKKKFYKILFLNFLKWQIEGQFDENIKKCVFIVVPHTSWLDFYIGVLVRGILDIEINFVGKKELFIFPFNYYFKWMGGVPLNREKNQDKVAAIASFFDKKDVFRMALSPEGTRKKVSKWRTGFYHIAKLSNVPIVPVAFDFENKKVIIHEPFYVTDNIEQDIYFLENLFINVKGLYPEKSFNR